MILKKGALIFLLLATVIEKRKPPLIKVLRKMYHREFKTGVVVCNESRVFVTHQIFIVCVGLSV